MLGGLAMADKKECNQGEHYFPSTKSGLLPCEFCGIKKQIEELSLQYANSIVPNPHKYDAPYYTTRDRHEDLEEAFIKGAEWGYQKALEERQSEEEINKAYFLNTEFGEPMDYDQFLLAIRRLFPNPKENA